MPKRCPRHTQGICSPLLVAGVNASIGPSTVLAASEQPPNILLIVVDDQSLFNLRVYNADSVLDTPVIVRFDNRLCHVTWVPEAGLSVIRHAT